MPKSVIFYVVALIGLTGLLLWQFPYAIHTGLDKQQLLTALAIACLSGSALLFRVGRSSEILRYGIYWLIVFAVILTGYTYKDALLNNPIISSLIPQRPVYRGEDIIFHSALDGHFYIEATIGTTKVRFMVDTGASDIVISPGDAERIGFAPASLTYNRIYNTANGVVRGAAVTLPSVDIGKLHLNNVPASVNGAEMDVSLLGIRFFQQFRRFVIEGNRLVITP